MPSGPQSLYNSVRDKVLDATFVREDLVTLLAVEMAKDEQPFIEWDKFTTATKNTFTGRARRYLGRLRRAVS